MLRTCPIPPAGVVGCRSSPAAERATDLDWLAPRAQAHDAVITRANELVALSAGKEAWRSTGNEFISRDWRMFLSGTGSTVVGDEVAEGDDTPVEFIMPDEPGFLSVSPKHGCGEVMSSFEAPAMSPLAGGQG